MRVESFFPIHIKAALENNPPGAWMPKLPENCIRLSSGYPAPSLIPTNQIKAAITRLIFEEKDLPFQYIGSPRIEKLKQQILQRMRKRGMNIREDDLLITSGACQAIDLIAHVLLDQQAVVAVEAPTYMEALETYQNYTKKIISIPVDANGLQTEVFAAVLEERRQSGMMPPKFLYTIPTFQNPTGTTMALERRLQLLKLAAEYDFLIVEDDAYGELAFGERPIPLKALDEEGRVMHVGSLSKVVAPGMRIGWIAGEKGLLKASSWFKKDLDHPFAQATMAAYMETIDLEHRLTILRDTYQTKCNTLIRGLEEYFPKSARWFVPKGGYFVWVQIPGVDTAKLLSQALAQGISFIPGKYFFLQEEEGKEMLRLSFSFAEEDDIEKGIKKLGAIVSSCN